MSFRTLEISKPTELHIINYQLLLYKKSLEHTKTNRKDSKHKSKPDYERLDDCEKICEIPLKDLAIIIPEETMEIITEYTNFRRHIYIKAYRKTI